jgi:voltage-gated potassium channel
LIYEKELLYFEAFISIVFAIEYLYRFFRAKKKLNFLITPIRIIDLISFLPFFLGFITI